MAWLANYSHRKLVTLSRSSGAVSNHQMVIHVCESDVADITEIEEDFSPHCMTAGSTPPWVASATSSYPGNAAFHAFSSDYETAHWVSNGNPTGYLQLDTGESYLLLNYTITASGDSQPNRAPKDWTLQGSNNGSDWTTLDTVTGETSWSNSESRNFVCDTTTTYYRYFKITVSANNGDGSYLSIGEFTLFGVKEPLSIVDCEGNCASDFDDIRFTTSDGETLLDYWIESIQGITPNQVARIWVEFDSIGTSNTTFYMYYGNESAVAYSNGDDTFLFFDDFNDNSIDSGKWTKRTENGTITEQNSRLEIDSSTGADYGQSCLDSSGYTTFREGIIEGKVYFAVNTLGEIGFRGGADNTGYKARFDSRASQGTSHLKPPYADWSVIGTVFGAIMPYSIWHNFKLTVYDDDSTCTMITDCNKQRKTNTSTTYATQSGRISLQNHYGNYSYFEDIRVREYLAIEPAWGSWGNEESLGWTGKICGVTNPSKICGVLASDIGEV